MPAGSIFFLLEFIFLSYHVYSFQRSFQLVCKVLFGVAGHRPAFRRSTEAIVYTNFFYRIKNSLSEHPLR